MLVTKGKKAGTNAANTEHQEKIALNTKAARRMEEPDSVSERGGVKATSPPAARNKASSEEVRKERKSIDAELRMTRTSGAYRRARSTTSRAI